LLVLRVDQACLDGHSLTGVGGYADQPIDERARVIDGEVAVESA